MSKKHIAYEIHLPEGIEPNKHIDNEIREAIENIIWTEYYNDAAIQFTKKLVVKG